MNSELLDELTTKFDQLNCFLEDEEDITLLDVKKMQEDVSKLVDFLESIGGRIKGVQYIKDKAGE